MHQLILNCIVAQHHNNYECVRVDVDKIKALYCRRCVGRDGERGIIRQLRGDLSDVAHHVVKLHHLVVKAAVYLLRLFDGELLLFHELVDVHSVACGSGDAPGRGVRLLEISHRGQLRELVADGGRAAAQVCDARNGFAAHRLRGFYILLDQCTEYFLFPFADTHLALNLFVCWHSRLTSANIALFLTDVKAFIQNFA